MVVSIMVASLGYLVQYWVKPVSASSFEKNGISEEWELTESIGSGGDSNSLIGAISLPPFRRSP
jgi:hypothetical protein